MFPMIKNTITATSVGSEMRELKSNEGQRDDHDQLVTLHNFGPFISDVKSLNAE